MLRAYQLGANSIPAMLRALRFGLSFHITEQGTAATARLHEAEQAGYSALQFADHLGSSAPLVSAAFAAAVTSRPRIGTFVLNNDFRHLALLAQEMATLDVLSEGRVELGLGAGHMKEEFDAAGLAFDRASVRIARMAEGIPLLRRLFAGETVTHDGDHHRLTDLAGFPVAPQGSALPILIGGNGDKLLAVAAQEADIVGLTGFWHPPGAEQVDLSHFSHEGLAERIAHVRREAGDRFETLELNLLVQQAVVTDDREAKIAELIDRGWPPDTADLPFALIGTVGQIADQIQAIRDRHGISYFSVFDEKSPGFEEVVARLAGE